ncbi:unnamed protein product [Tetraodon nigroviridis]|uniref:(spotted green pufferfish) hypothetical protein n=1 Tax=Tetraodon nigroviridis TaxID=99883 RepID=Q4SD61_TETNG|nr:unnamed protein product [Tetraodon nigroviridis]
MKLRAENVRKARIGQVWGQVRDMSLHMAEKRALSHLTLCSISPSWWVIQLTIWPTVGPKRPGSTTVQAVTG